MFATFLARLVPFKLWLTAGAVAVVLAGFGYLSLQLDSARSALEVASARITVLQTQLEAAQAGLEAMQVEAQRLSKRADIAKAAAEELQQAAADRVVQILTSPVPDSCPAAIDFLVQDARRAQ